MIIREHSIEDQREFDRMSKGGKIPDLKLNSDTNWEELIKSTIESKVRDDMIRMLEGLIVKLKKES